MTEPGVGGPPVPGPLASSPALGTDMTSQGIGGQGIGGQGIGAAPDAAGQPASRSAAASTASIAQPAGPDAPLLRRTRRRLVAWSAVTMLVALLVLGVAIYGAVASSLAATSQGQLEQRAAGLQRFIANAPGMPDRFGNQPDVGISFGGPAPNTIAMIVTPSGTTEVTLTLQ